MYMIFEICYRAEGSLKTNQGNRSGKTDEEVQNDLDFEDAVTECRILLTKSLQRRKVEGFYLKRDIARKACDISFCYSTYRIFLLVKF